VRLLAPALAAGLLIAACGSSSSSSTTASTASGSAAGSAGVQVKTAADAALGGAVLVDSRGMTLYHLTGETAGKFICTGACLKIWHPLIASGGSSPSGTVGSLGTVTRSDGTLQVTFKGEPLYTFVKDTSRGEATGQGIKDVGTCGRRARECSEGRHAVEQSSCGHTITVGQRPLRLLMDVRRTKPSIAYTF